jgi:hypothetical protein
MTRAVIIALALVALVAGPAFAGGRHGHGGRGHGHGHGGHRLHSSLPTRVVPHHHHRFHGHTFHGHTFHRHGGGFGVFVAPPILGYGFSTYGYAPPPAYYPPASIPPVTYAPSPTYAPRPEQKVVEFPNGRYVLHGDGITTPYRWVWIPNPPPAPPADEPAAPPAVPAPAPTSMPAPPRSLEFYRWTDDDGVTHFSDGLDRVPEPYRATATRSNT